MVELFKDHVYPVGEIQKYPVDDRTAVDRFTSEEKKAIDAAHNEIYNEIRLAAEAHRQTRQHMQKWIKPGKFSIDHYQIPQLILSLIKLRNDND